MQYQEDIFETMHVHNTTTIEGNKLSENQVGDLLEKGIVPEDKSLREVNEVQNLCRSGSIRRLTREKSLSSSS
ncbi:hypothetical protein [Methanosarcina horonobensis]|uniref:hypothetical protein n=1 Tax=Methanosarcina horonobensis TaxID=418008 RepID=UPI0013013CDB|nr:hypothetical protein [Methanosarcina horonobensis]